MLDFLHNHSSVNETGKFCTQFIIQGKPVCRESWLLIHDIKKGTFSNLYEKVKAGVVCVEHGNVGLKKPTKKTKDCIAWLEFSISCVGKHQPDQQTIHLPSCFNIKSIYLRMVEENNGFGLESVAQSQFYNIFKKEFPAVIIPKVNGCLNYVLKLSLKQPLT